MVARGDLGVEVDLATVPIIQKDLIHRCQAAGKPVIVATQMLQSMVDAASPTRAEVSDVANAVYDGTDAVMLSGETSVGKFPILAVHTMTHVAEVTEAYLAKADIDRGGPSRLKTLQTSAAVARGVRQIVQELDMKLVVMWSQSGATARIFSKSRFPVPVIALSNDRRTLRQMAMYYGVLPQEMPAPENIQELVANTDRLITAGQFAGPGDRIVIVVGAAMATPGTLNGVFLHTIGAQFSTSSIDVPPSAVTGAIGGAA
jgi:pyruvate kinase